jgi:hypothetical protein
MKPFISLCREENASESDSSEENTLELNNTQTILLKKFALSQNIV